MAEIITMPRLSDTMEEGTVATWLKKVGDTVKEGDILAEIETDKATMEFESFYEGTLLHIGVDQGQTAEVDALLAIIGDADEDISGLLSGASSDQSSSTAEPDDQTQETATSNPVDTPSSEPSASQSSAALPEGVTVITMPRLSDTMEEGTVASWLKKEGDTVSEGDILAEIETDKATMEFESFYSGTLLKIGVQEGASAQVDALLAVVGPEGTDLSGVNLESHSAVEVQAETPPVAVPSQPTNSQPETPSKATKETANEAVTTPTQKAAVGAPETIVADQGRRFVSPLARKLAEEKGINLAQVTGTGEHGRIIKRDIEHFVPAAAGAPVFQSVGTEVFESMPNSQMRKTIAKRLGESKFTAPHYYLTVELDMDHAIAARTAINTQEGVKISFNDMVVKACAMALRLHPKVNSQWHQQETKIAKHIHMGVAVAVDDGLVVPVLKFADQMSFTQIGAAVKDLAGKARSKKLTPDQMQGSTFTVSNLGMFGIREFTSIINQPNSAILSVGAIVEKPVVKQGAIVVGHTMTVTLACDHRTVDGATGAQFLQTLRQYIEQPVTMFA